MRKVVVLLIVGVVLFGACAQRSDAQAITVAKLVGTWVDNAGTDTTWVFNANGNLTWSASSSSDWKFVVTDTKLAIAQGSDVRIYDILMSADGRTLVLYSNSRAYWLTKR